jgi:hypothetical protein
MSNGVGNIVKQWHTMGKGGGGSWQQENMHNWCKKSENGGRGGRQGQGGDGSSRGWGGWDNIGI